MAPRTMPAMAMPSSPALSSDLVPADGLSSDLVPADGLAVGLADGLAVGLAVGLADTQSSSETPSGSRRMVVTAVLTPQSQGTLVKGLSKSHLEEGRGCGCAKRGGAVEWRGSAASTGRDGGQRA